MSDRADIAGASRPMTGAVFSDPVAGGPKRMFLRAGGLSRDAVRRRPIIGICSSWSELNPCNMGLRDLAEAVRRGVTAAGGTALVFPTISLHEQLVAPTTMLLRNLMAMDVEEMIRCSPIDGVVLLAGCDKTVPAQLMGAASAGKPAIMLTAGPRSWARFRGAPVVTDDGWRLASEFLEGRMTSEEVDALEDVFCAGVGVCNVMGTANTMAVMAETLGMALPGSALVPATYAQRSSMAEMTGARAVALAQAGIIPEAILTGAAFDNALRVLVAMGGSTNAVIHLEAIAGRLRLTLGLDRLERISRETPQVLGVRPSGIFSLEDFDEAGGVPALLRVLVPLLDRDAAMGDGRTVAQVAETAGGRPHPCLRSLDDPFEADGGLVVLRGSLAPRGAILKRSAAPPETWTHRGPALVFDDYRTALERSFDPNLEATPDTVLVLRNAGPVGAPGMPEIDVIPIPISLRQRGVREMVCITDGRMSGTEFGTVALHVTPEAAIGGPIGLVEDGDEIVLDARRGLLDLRVDDRTLAWRAEERRDARPRPVRGYEALYVEHVLQADEGCDLDFLADRTTGQAVQRNEAN